MTNVVICRPRITEQISMIVYSQGVENLTIVTSAQTAAIRRYWVASHARSP